MDFHKNTRQCTWRRHCYDISQGIHKKDLFVAVDCSNQQRNQNTFRATSCYNHVLIQLVYY